MQYKLGQEVNKRKQAKKWNEFKKRYLEELDGKKEESVNVILQKFRTGYSVLLFYGAKDEKFNNAAALKEYLLKKQFK